MVLMPEHASGDALRYFLAGDGGLVLHLFVSNTTPSETDTVDSYVEASWPGYEPITLVAKEWTIVEGVPSVATYAKQTFTATEGNLHVINYGYFMTRLITGRIGPCERFPGPEAPFLIANHGDTISVRPKLSGGSLNAAVANLRQGMWVRAEDSQIGVINGFNADGKAQFQRVGVEGLKELDLLLDPETLTQASWREIPESRRPDRETAAKFGYN